MKKTEITATTATTQHKEQLSSTDLSSFASLTDLCRKVPSVQYLLEEWHTEYNSDPERTPNLNHISSPDHIRPTDTSPVWWKCRNGHEWQAPVARRTGKRKIGCPGCSGSITYKKYEAMGCKKGFEHFHQGAEYAWRKG